MDSQHKSGLKNVCKIVGFTWIIIGMIVVVGCSDKEDDRLQLSGYKDTVRDIQFNYPMDWVVEELEEPNVLLIYTPKIEENWQTNIFIEKRVDLDTKERSFESRLVDIITNLEIQHNRE